jgi:hypothetical protein
VNALASIIAPFSWGRAVELGNRTWSKKVLPIGSISYQGRTLNFTPAYLAGLVDAFRDRAYDQVPLQLADASNAHTNDPERTAGWIDDLELREDGLYCLATVTARGERVLSENPRLGVSARIVEQYNRADGKFYPAAVQHVLGTLDPRVPGLGAWTPVDMANEDGIVIDLSGSTFDADPEELTDQELADLIDAMSDDEPGGELGDDELEAWVDSLTDDELAALEAEAAADGDYDDALGELSAAFSNTYATAQARASARADADAADTALAGIRARNGHRESTEDVLARAFQRIGQGIYTDETALASQNMAIALSRCSGLCGLADPVTGRCAAPYHTPDCHDGYGSGMDAGIQLANSGAYASALDGLAAGLAGDGGGPRFIETTDPYGGAAAIPQRTLELAHELAESWGLHSGGAARGYDPAAEDLFGVTRSRDAYSDMARELGRDALAEPQPGYDGYPDVSALAQAMGLK